MSTYTPYTPRPRRPTRSAPPPPIETENEPGPPQQEPEQQSVSDAPVVDSPVSSPVADPQSDHSSPSDLSPLRAHYLKKSLIQLQLRQELELLLHSHAGNVSTLSYLGPPFAPPPKDAPPLDLPFLRYIFRQFVLTFPFMAAAPKDFYSDKLQPFVASVLSRNISPTSVFEDGPDGAVGEVAFRKKLVAKLERNLALFIGASTKLVEEEEVVRLSQADLDRLEEVSKRRQEKMKHLEKDVFDVNIISVRTVVDKGRVRSRAHEEFIIRTRRSRYPDVFVSRRYGDFRTLAEELRKRYPAELVPNPPAKDKTTVNAPSASSPTSFHHPLYDQRSVTSASSTDSFNSLHPPPSSSSSYARLGLAREKNRLTLRAYLHSLLASNTLGGSPVMQSFLTTGQTKMSESELEDAQRREEADRVREDGRKKFAKEVAARVEGLREAVRGVKGDIMGKDGLTKVFGTIKVTPNVKDLPDDYQAVLEWARISMASTVFHQFVAADNSSETFASLKRIHGLMPYFMLRAALKISNPVGMIRSVMDLFLAQPFGGRSLLQRMFTSSLSEEVKVLEEDIQAVKEKVDDPAICEKIKQFIYAPREIQDMFKADAVSENQNLITVVLRSGDEPALSRAQMYRVARAHRAHAAYLKHRESLADSDDDDGPQDEDAWLYEDIKVLASLYSRLRDREMLIGLLFEGFTSELLKDIITIFYSPLAQVYKAASIADSLSDLQNFINDLIKTVEQVEELNQEDPHKTVQAFIDLIQRHEQAFYSFVHKVHSKGEGLFDSLMRWIELFLTVVREGLGPEQEPVSLEFLLPHTGTDERNSVMAEIDSVAKYHYRLKVLYEDKLRKRFGRVQGGSGGADEEDEATQLLVNGVVGEISFGELVQGDAIDLAAEETDENEEFDSDSEDEESGSEEDSSEEDSSDDSDDSSNSSGSIVRLSRANTLGASIDRRSPTKATLSRHASAAARQTTSESSPRPPPPSKHHNPSRSRETTPRPRSLSLKSSRSMNFFKRSSGNANGLTASSSPSSRRSHDVAPPVPPLPSASLSQPRSSTSSYSSVSSAAVNKPLPPSPAPPRSSRDHSTPRPPSAPAPAYINPPKRKGRSKAKPQPLQPPELTHISELLPIFTEMMRPRLRPRQRTNPTSM